MGCELSESNISALIAAISALVGVAIGILGEHWLNAMRQRKTVQGVKQAFYEELNTFWEQLSEEVRVPWIEYEQNKETGGFFDYLLDVPTDYFTIYSSNASYLGQIDDSELRAKIIKVYLSLQALMHGYRKNTEYLREYIEVRDRYEKEKAKVLAAVVKNIEKYSRNFAEVQAIEVLVNKSLRQLTRYAVELKEAHDNFTELIEDFLEGLKKELPQPRTERFWE